MRVGTGDRRHLRRYMRKLISRHEKRKRTFHTLLTPDHVLSSLKSLFQLLYINVHKQSTELQMNVTSNINFYFRATLGVKEVLQSSKFSTLIFWRFIHSTSLPESRNVFQKKCVCVCVCLCVCVCVSVCVSVYNFGPPLTISKPVIRLIRNFGYI